MGFNMLQRRKLLWHVHRLPLLEGTVRELNDRCLSERKLDCQVQASTVLTSINRKTLDLNRQVIIDIV